MSAVCQVWPSFVVLLLPPLQELWFCAPEEAMAVNFTPGVSPATTAAVAAMNSTLLQGEGDAGPPDGFTLPDGWKEVLEGGNCGKYPSLNPKPALFSWVSAKSCAVGCIVLLRTLFFICFFLNTDVHPPLSDLIFYLNDGYSIRGRHHSLSGVLLVARRQEMPLPVTCVAAHSERACAPIGASDADALEASGGDGGASAAHRGCGSCPLYLFSTRHFVGGVFLLICCELGLSRNSVHLTCL
jgi:hypothetical protein